MADNLTQVLVRLSQMERKIDALAKPKPSWVKASTILELTRWNAVQLRAARINDTIKYKELSGRIFLYDLNSLHPYLIKKS